MRMLKNLFLMLFCSTILLSCGISKRQAVTNTATAYLTAKKDFNDAKMYELINPSAKKQISKETFTLQQKRYANFNVTDFSIKNIDFTDSSHAVVEVIFVVGKGKGNVETSFPFIYEDGSWYREYPLYETNKK